MAVRARMVAANGLEFGLLEAGTGPLVLCLHGSADGCIDVELVAGPTSTSPRGPA